MGYLAERKGDGGPILLDTRGLSHRIVPCFYFTITYCYTAKIVNYILMDRIITYSGED